MAEISRRNFLIKGGTGAAALGALAVVPSLGNEATAAQRKPATLEHRAPATAVTTDAGAATQSFLVHIPDAKTGEVHFMFGSREVVKTDKELVARLLRDAR